MNNDEKIEALIAALDKKNNKTDYGMVLRWVAGIVSAIVVYISVNFLDRMTQNVENNKDGIILLKAETKNTNIIMNSLLDSINELRKEFSVFNRKERFGKADNVEALDNYHQSKVEPVSRRVDRIEATQNERKEVFKDIQRRITNLESKKGQ